MEDNKTGMEYVGEFGGVNKYIDYDNKTVIYVSGTTWNGGISMCSAPLLEKEEDGFEINELETNPTKLR